MTRILAGALLLLATACDRKESAGSSSSGGGGGAPESSAPEITLTDGGNIDFKNQGFDFDSGKIVPAGTGNSFADLQFLRGQNVDISVGWNGDVSSKIFDFNKSFASVDEIPDEPTGATEASYVEGMNGLKNRGILVTDVETGKKRFKMLIVSNGGATVKFRYKATKATP